MPKPQKSETRDEFLSRCVEYIVEKEGKESDQAYAMCVSIWEEEKSNNTIELNIKDLYNKYMDGVK